ncbi:hypothetical protein ACQUQU_03415 [Thalassolituus sp. LLYu03]|uniref:hypothetical protein n=1 Tax=Thalassolituus sp. LLYu03 TaxID=3421656 RepID=UPI003D277E44
MKEHYLCCACARTFPPDDAIDGYNAGFKSGFLCPYCKANLTEQGQSDDFLHLKYGVPYALCMVLIFGVTNMEWIELPFTGSAMVDSVLSGLLLALIPTLLFLMVNRKALRGTRTLFTRRVDNRD